MNKDNVIHSWPASYYMKNEKRWTSGVLSLTLKSLMFQTSKDGQNLFTIRLSNIIDLKKESSSFIFSSLTVLDEGNIKHWFSSLQPSRCVVFNVIEHFWREQLLPPEGESTASVPGPSKGKQLIGLMCNSQKRLEDTGKILDQQKEQFNNIMVGLDKIESDLHVADRFLSELETPAWWPFGKFPWRNQKNAKAQQEPAATSTTCITEKALGNQNIIIKIPILYSKGEDSNPKPGSLVVLLSYLEITDSSFQLVHQYRREEIDDIRIYSPYELSLRQRFIGKPDITYRLLSAKMPEAFSVLEMQYKKKLQFMPDYFTFTIPLENSPYGKEDKVWCSESGCIDHIRQTEPLPEEENQEQIQAQEILVTDSEAQELKQVLMKLKNLALEAKTELECQDETLDAITSATERATTHIEKHNRRMKKLM
ncbi:synaptosomal-associated protein 47 [Erpetoichthys calabaricus]|uniref:Synaptosomal-associated protein 47 n=1 Tax=Erpetoichthys calabaricus TaxID=27687 RepID=A0A8C4RFT5_ERPCA|nr:synaptosomal-associated protein 47 [Erpetoichthys calabaricus]XP_028659730.1 synaptosomal-associated protein 47 [Erpetoichthys calabaricus]